MEAKNFRIGNLVKTKVIGFSDYEKIGQIVTIKGILQQSGSVEILFFDTTQKEFSFQNINGLLLNKDLLCDFGFIKSNRYSLHFRLNGILIKMHEGQFNLYKEIDINNEDFGGWFVKSIKYVHDLQNLFFALTNEELQFKSDM